MSKAKVVYQIMLYFLAVAIFVFGHIYCVLKQPKIDDGQASSSILNSNPETDEFGFFVGGPCDVWDGTSEAPTLRDTTLSNSESNPYIIDTAEKLKWISANYNSGAQDKYYLQTVNIDLDDRDWASINSTTTGYKYYYDGGHHTVFNLHIVETIDYAKNVGLFGYNNGGYIKNLKVENGIVDITRTTAGDTNIACVCGALWNGTADSLYNKDVVVTAKNTTNKAIGVAGIVSSVRDSTIRNCVNNSDLSIHSNGGQYYKVSGIVNEFISAGNGVIENCANYGNFKTTEAINTAVIVGGIVAQMSAKQFTGKNLVNYGDISILESSSSNGGAQYVGGIIGWIMDTNTSLSLENLTNYGSLDLYLAQSQGCYAGGVVGICQPTATNGTANYLSNYGSLHFCGNNAEKNFHVGGLFGYFRQGTLTNSYNKGTISDDITSSAILHVLGGIIGQLNLAVSHGGTTVISNCYSAGQMYRVPSSQTTFGGLIGILNGDNVSGMTLTNCYYDNQVISSAGTGTSPTEYYGSGSTTGWSATNVTGLTTNQMQSAEDGVAPVGMTGFTAENWVFKKYAYPTLNVGYRPESGLEAGTTETELVYNATAQTPQVKVSSYGNSEFSDSKPKSVWDGESVAIPLLKNTALANTETNPYIIDSAAKLAYLSAHPDWGNNKYVKQTVNIDLNWHKWTPINIIHANSGTPNYKYYYDGGNSIIYNLYIEENDAPSVGLFAYFQLGYIKNLLINGSKVVFKYSGQVTGRNINIGTLMGNPNGTTIENCHVKNGSVKATNNYLAHIGGLVGYVWGRPGSIKNCSCDCSVWGDNHWTDGIMRVGGIAGHIQTGALENCVNYGSVFGYSRTSSYNDGIIIGGIAGWIQGVETIRCINYGDVSIDSISNCQMGGITGNYGVYSASSSNAKLEYCANYGNLMAISTSTTKYNHVGGIVGWQNSTTSDNLTATLNYLINGGAVNSNAKLLSTVGGLIGAGSTFEISNAISYGSVRQNLEHNSSSRTGGLIGTATTVTATNCYYNITTMGNNADLYDGLSYTNISRGCGNLSSVVGNGLTTGQMLVKTTGTSPVCMTLSGEWKYVEGEYPTFKETMTGGAFKYSEVDQNILTSEPVSTWDGKSVENFTEGSGTSASDPYIIDSAAKLAYLSKNYKSFSGKYFKQTIDIDLNNHLWAPIAPNDANNYNYKYDGNYHTIFNLYVYNIDDGGDGAFGGLFGKLGNNGYVKNLTINGGSVYTYSENWKSYAGAFAGFMYSTGGVIENCHNIGVSIFAERPSSASQDAVMGGIVGWCRDGQIINCTNRSDIDIMKKEQVQTIHAGGIVGVLVGTSSQQAQINGCVNYGNIYNSNESFVYQNIGGIAGFVSWVDSSSCVNYGSVTLVGKVFECLGGMYGNAENTLTLSSVKNYGTVYIADINSTANRQRFVGGIIGRIKSSGANATLTSIENIGDVYCIGNVLSGNQNATMPGGIIGITYANTTANGIINRGSVIAHSETNNMGSPSNWIRVGSFAAIFHTGTFVINDFMNTGSVWSTYRYNYVSGSSIVTPQTVSGGSGGGHTDKMTNTAGILLGNVENSASVTFRRCYWDSQKVSSNLKCIIRGTFLSNTGWNFLAFGLDVYSPTATVGGGSASQTSCVGVTTANLSVSTAGSAPSGASDLSSTYFDFSTVGTYPTLKASLTLSNPAYEKKCKVQNITSSRSVWDGTSSEKPTGEGTKINPYKIASAANLYWLALYPNLGHNKYFVQTVDIDLAMHEWTPINGDGTSQNYTYYYDGNYHTIYNLYMNKTYTVGDSYVTFRCALFGTLYGDSYLKNLSLNGGSITVTTQYGSNTRDFGIVVGSMVAACSGLSNSRATLYNLHNIGVNVTVYQNGGNDAWTNTSALIGTVGNCDLKNLSNSGNLYVESYAQEWTGHGGCVSSISNASIAENLYNSGNIYMETFAASPFAGGVTSYLSANSVLRNSVNVGNVSAKGLWTAFAGGVVCFLQTGSLVSNCVNYGTIYAESTTSGNMNAGGIVSWMYHTATHLETYTTLARVEYCINYGLVTSDSGRQYNGAIVANISDYGEVANCYFNTDLVNKIGTNITTKAVYFVNQGTVDTTTIKGLTTTQMTCSADGTMPAALVGFDSNIWKCYNGYMPTIVAGNYGVTYKNNVHAGTATALVIFDERSGFIGTKEANFTIVQAINSWVRNPAIAGWTYTHWPSTPVGQALFGTVSFSYLDANDNSVTLTTASNAGSYKLVAEVALSDDYTMLRVVVPFTISPLDFSSLIQIDLSGTSFVYDGQSHTPTETVTKTS